MSEPTIEEFLWIQGCPFCGNIAILKQSHILDRLGAADEFPDKGGFCVECLSCHAAGPVVFALKDVAIKIAVRAWNCRAQYPTASISGVSTPQGEPPPSR